MSRISAYIATRPFHALTADDAPALCAGVLAIAIVAAVVTGMADVPSAVNGGLSFILW